MITLKELAQMNLVFSAPSIQLLWTGSVQKLNTHGKLQTRILSVTSVAICLLETKFGITKVLSRMIPFCDLYKVSVTSKEITLTGTNDVSMTIQHNDLIKIASITYSVQQMLFSEQKIILDISDDIKAKMDEQCFIFETDNVLRDRFLSYLLSRQEKFTVDQLNSFIDNFTKDNVNITITKELAQSNLASAYSDAVAFLETPKVITFDSLDVSQFVDCFATICKNNISITKIIFRKVTINNSLMNLYQAWAEGSMIKAEKFYFLHSDLTTDHYIDFFKGFDMYTTPIVTLKFFDCKFTTQSFRSTLEGIITSPCFGRLSSLTLNAIKCKDLSEPILHLLTCNWMTNERQLKDLNLGNCGLDLREIIPYILHNETGVTSLDLSGNTCSGEIPYQQDDSFGSINSLTCRNIAFNGEGFTSLLKIAANTPSSPQTIDLQDTKLFGPDLVIAYNEICNIELPDLWTLNWSGIPVKMKKMQQFTAFLTESLPALKSLNVSNCFDPDELKEVSQVMSDIIKQKGLIELSLGFDNPSELSIEKTKYLAIELSFCVSLKSLDIHGLIFNIPCIEALTNMLSYLQFLNIEGCISGANLTSSDQPVSADILYSFIQQAKGQNVVVFYTDEDVKKSIHSLKSKEAQKEYTRKFKSLKRETKKPNIQLNPLTKADLSASTMNLLQAQHKMLLQKENEEGTKSSPLIELPTPALLKSAKATGIAMLKDLPSTDQRVDEMVNLCTNGESKNIFMEYFIQSMETPASLQLQF